MKATTKSRSQTMPAPPATTKRRSLRVKLIFNPVSGSSNESPVQLMEVIREMQLWDIVPEIYMIEPECDLHSIIRNAVAQGIGMVVVCGGDGTIAAVAKALINTGAVLGIVAIGTQNNIALSLGIPIKIAEAVALLRDGQRAMIDAGTATNPAGSSFFIEMCSVGLFSTLYTAGDEVQHGNVGKLGDFLTILTKTPPSQMHITLDDGTEIRELGHVVLICNMPYMGQHYRVGDPDAFRDGLLDVLFFSDLSKLDLISYVVRGPGTSQWEDPRIQHFRVRKVVVRTEPEMPVMIDGETIGSGSVVVEVQKKALAVMIPLVENTSATKVKRLPPDSSSKPGEEIELRKPDFKGFLGKMIGFTAAIPAIFRIIGSIALLIGLLILSPLTIRDEAWSAIESNIVLVSFLLAFCVIALSLIWKPGQRLDVRLLLFLNLNKRRSAFWDATMLTITQIGSGVFTFLFALVLAIAGEVKPMYAFLLGSISLLLIVEFLKFLFQRSRPYVVLNSVRVVGSQDSGRSFPSGHTSQAFFMATFMAVHFALPIAATVAFFATAFLVAITRMYVGMHYPRDVIGGALLGVSWGLCGVLFAQFIFQLA